MCDRKWNRCRRFSGRSPIGFTIVELLVVIAVVGLLIVLLLPAVNAAREAGRRVTCVSKIRNLALAIENHQSAHGVYPGSRFRVPEDVGPDSRSWSWITKVLPFIEEQALYDQLDLASSTLSNKTQFLGRPLAFLICPSDGTTPNPSRLGSGHFDVMSMGVTNYKAVSGANWGADESQRLDDIGSRWRNPGFHGSFDGQNHGDGIMWRNDERTRMRAALIRDGLSKTLLLGEDVPAWNLWNSWAYTNNVFGTCAIPPNVTDANPSWWPDSMGFRSDHRGGLNFAFADGAVKFIPNSIDLKEYRQLATRDGAANQ